MIKGKTRKIAGIVAVVLAVGGGAYLTGAKALGACDAKAKASKASATSGSATTCEKVHASAMASSNGSCEAKAKNTATTTASAVKADDCCASEATHTVMTSKNGSCEAKATQAVLTSKNGSCEAKAKSTVMTDADACPMKAQATKTASAKAGDCSEGACPMEKGAKEGASKKVEQKAAPKRTMASVVPAAETAK